MQALAEQSRIVRLPLNQVGAVNKINRAVNRFEQEHERKPSTQELSDDVDLPVDKIDEAMAANTRHVSMDAPFSDSDDSSLLDLLANDDIPDTDRSLVDESLKTEVSQALMTLSERERNIVKAFFGIGQPEMTLDEIGMKFGLTRERVRQIKEKALRHLRNNSKHNTLKGYLGQ
jgi:RNA polymerase primary sigma factor